MLTINGAWYVDQLPTMLVAEMDDGTLKMFHLTPFREIKAPDLLAYTGHHPRKMKGNPLPGYLYRHYGLEKSQESLTAVIHVRLTPSEKEKFEAALPDGESVSDSIRKYVQATIRGE